MRILICGDRHYDCDHFIVGALQRLLHGVRFPTATVNIASTNITIIHGGAKGADTIAGRIARTMNWTEEVHKANWSKYKGGAGPIRNIEMFKSRPNLILAFHSDLMQSRGTKHMISYALKHVNKLPTPCPIILIWGNPSKDQWIELPPGSDLSDWSWTEVKVNQG